MSGGVDSSVSAALLKQQGYKVEGIYMKNWDTRDERGVCPSEQDWQDVQSVCHHLNIPCTQVDFVKDYWNEVFQTTLDEYEAGATPNPDVMCNQHIKFGSLLNKIPKDTWLATGHYCRTDGYGRLLRGKEPTKDQSYYLSTVPYHALQRTIFPLGDIQSKQQQVKKELIKELGLYNILANKKESYGICFVGQHRKFAEFLGQYIDQPAGQAKCLETDKVIGEHKGLFGYTIGQAAHIHHGQSKWFVAHKDIKTNTLYCVPGSNHAALFHRACLTRNWVWLHPSFQPINYKVKAQVRYRQEPLDAWISIDKQSGGKYKITFDQPIRAMAIGQQVVIWDNDWCLGSGTIDEIIPAYS
ncbi:tRNA methyl transferase [Cunninghamella echinulata]|nr:tRNA methyl transferase [Cunninghamella echinulata]